MAVLTSFRDPGGQIGDEYIDEQGRWFIQVVFRDTDYFWSLVQPLTTPQPSTAISTLINDIEGDVDALEAAQAQDEIDVDNLLSRVGILEVDLDAAENEIINLQGEVDLPDLIVLFNNAVL